MYIYIYIYTYICGIERKKYLRQNISIILTGFGAYITFFLSIFLNYSFLQFSINRKYLIIFKYSNTFYITLLKDVL